MTDHTISTTDCQWRIQIDSKLELTKIEEHGDEDDDSEPDVELDREVNDGDNDVDESWDNGEDDVVEKSVDRGRTAIHDPQNFTGLSKLNIGSC